MYALDDGPTQRYVRSYNAVCKQKSAATAAAQLQQKQWPIVNG